MSGGFTATIAPVAKLLSIPAENISANVILFDELTGDYAGFDVEQPTSKTGGKVGRLFEYFILKFCCRRPSAVRCSQSTRTRRSS